MKRQENWQLITGLSNTQTLITNAIQQSLLKKYDVTFSACQRLFDWQTNINRPFSLVHFVFPIQI